MTKCEGINCTNDATVSLTFRPFQEDDGQISVAGGSVSYCESCAKDHLDDSRCLGAYDITTGEPVMLLSASQEAKEQLKADTEELMSLNALFCLICKEQIIYTFDQDDDSASVLGIVCPTCEGNNLVWVTRFYNPLFPTSAQSAITAPWWY